jgi:hypothetical protein
MTERCPVAVEAIASLSGRGCAVLGGLAAFSCNSSRRWLQRSVDEDHSVVCNQGRRRDFDGEFSDEFSADYFDVASRDDATALQSGSGASCIHAKGSAGDARDVVIPSCILSDFLLERLVSLDHPAAVAARIHCSLPMACADADGVWLDSGDETHSDKKNDVGNEMLTMRMLKCIHDVENKYEDEGVSLYIL